MYRNQSKNVERLYFIYNLHAYEYDKISKKHRKLKRIYHPSGAIIFGSDQEVAGVMRAVRRNNASGVFSWIGSDGWSARNLVSDGNELEVS